MESVLLGWLATVTVLFGYILNAKQIVWSWIVWFIGNSIMLVYGLLINSYSLATLSGILMILNLYGYYAWRSNQD